MPCIYRHIPEIPLLIELHIESMCSVHYFNVFVCFSMALFLISLHMCFNRWDCSAHEPASCRHRGCSRPAEVRKTGPSPVRTCARSLLRYPEAKHTAVQQLRVSVGLRRTRLFPLLQGSPMQIRFIFLLYFMHFPTPRCPLTSVFSLSVFFSICAVPCRARIHRRFNIRLIVSFASETSQSLCHWSLSCEQMLN